MIADINKDLSESKLISFADDTRIYTKINHDVSDCNLLHHDRNYTYDWETTNKIDCSMKISSFYGYVNKLNANFGHLQATVLSRLCHRCI